MRTKSRLHIAALALLTVGILSVPAISQAHKKTYATTVTAAAKNKNQVEGKVSSSKLRCLPQRLVQVFSSTGALEATTTTDSQGNFHITPSDMISKGGLSVGTHSLNVKRGLLLKNRHHKHTCGAAKTSFVVS
jgi:hypothetical protein